MTEPASGGLSAGTMAVKVSWITVTAIVVADTVGVGVFTSLGFQVLDITSGFALLMLWIVGGIVAVCGALCYAELATMLPRSSGEYNFLRRIFHPAFGFVAGWLSATVGFAAPIALAAMAFGSYFWESVAPGVSPVVATIPLYWPGHADFAVTWPLLLGFAISWIAALVHLAGVRFGGLYHNIWTAMKVVLIVVLIIAGLVYGDTQHMSFAPSAVDLTQIGGAPFAISLVFVMYSYSGWNAATYIVDEVQDPARTVPRALFVGTGVVIVLYVALNAVFLMTTPIKELAGQIDVALVAGTHIFGSFGGRLVGGLICLGLVSSISAMTWIGPRVAMTMGEDMPLLRMFSRRSKQGVPAIAIVFQLVVSNLLLLTQSFEAVLDFIQFSLTFCSFFTVLGLIKMRITHPNLPRPYRAWGYPVTPLIFLIVTLFMMYYLVVNRPLQSLAGVAMMLAGLVVYYLSRPLTNVSSSDVSQTVA